MGRLADWVNDWGMRGLMGKSRGGGDVGGEWEEIEVAQEEKCAA